MENFEKNAKLFKAFCDPNRLRILKLLETGELCACSLLEKLEIGQPTLSHHMKILCDLDIVKSYKVGKWTHYYLNEETIAFLNNFLSSLVK